MNVSKKKMNYKSKTPKVSQSVKRYVNQKIKSNVETKERAYVDNFHVLNNVGLSFQYPTQGVSNQQRIGDEIKLQSLRVRGIVANVSTVANHFYRMVIYKSRSTTILPFTDMFYGLSSTQIPAILNNNYMTVLSDRTWALENNGSGALKSFDITIPLRNMKVTFDEGTTTPKEETLHLHVFQCDQQGTPVNNQCRITYDAILRFKDA